MLRHQNDKKKYELYKTTMECGKVDRVGEVEIGDATKCATNFSNKRKLTNCFIKEKYTRNKKKCLKKKGK